MTLLLAHIGQKDDITRGYVEGVTVRAFCGADFVPSRDPNQFPPCAECETLWQMLFPGKEVP